jgi:hypothetical protein
VSGARGRGPARVADLLRLAPVAAGIVLAADGRAGEAAFAFALLAPVLALRAAKPSPWLDLALAGALAVHVLGEALGLFARWSWEDDVAHVLLPLLTVPVVRAGLVRLGALPAELEDRPAGARVAILAVLAASVIGLGALWELVEWASDGLLGTDLSLGYRDTLTDLLADAAGALVGAAGVGASAARLGSALRRRKRTRPVGAR